MQNKTHKKLSIALGIVCFLIAAMMIVYSVILIKFFVDVINSTKNPADFYYVPLVMFAAFFNFAAKVLAVTFAAFCVYICIVFALDGISFIKNSGNDNDYLRQKKSLRLSFGFCIALLIFSGYRFIIGLGRIIKHGPQNELFTFLIFGLLPTVLYVTCIVLNRRLLSMAKNPEAKKQNERL